MQVAARRRATASCRSISDSTPHRRDPDAASVRQPRRPPSLDAPASSPAVRATHRARRGVLPHRVGPRRWRRVDGRGRRLRPTARRSSWIRTWWRRSSTWPTSTTAATSSSRRRRSTNSAIGLESDFFEAHFNLGNIYHDLGRFREAQACYREALRLNPVIRRRALLSRGDASKRWGCRRSARPHWRALPRARAARRVGRAGEGILGVDLRAPAATIAEPQRLLWIRVRCQRQFAAGREAAAASARISSGIRPGCASWACGAA